ncbi:MAG: potassium-transporting ATPase subunit KdpB [Cyanobacteria bacterium P01_A01_bin.84]
MMQSLNPPSSRPPRSRLRDRRSSRQKIQINMTRMYLRAIKNAFLKLNPGYLISNPVLFLIWLGTIVSLVLTFVPNIFGLVITKNPRLFHGSITGAMFLLLWMSNFAPALAESRGKSQANALRATKKETITKKLFPDGAIAEVSSNTLLPGDTIYVVAGDLIPVDGEVTMGVASVDESDITGESAPVLKESGSDVASSVTGGTRIISDELIIRVTAQPNKGFLDRMIALVEGKARKKTSLEVTLNLLINLQGFLIILVIISIAAIANFLGSPISASVFVGILAALLPTTINGLLTTISIAGVDKAAQSNVIATSVRTIENCSNIDILFLDKTGTITLGNRLAESFYPLNNRSLEELAYVSLAASIFDDTPEGKSIVRLAERLGARIDFDRNFVEGVPFCANSRMSGTNLPSGRMLRKGSVAAIIEFIRQMGGEESPEIQAIYERVATAGGTPLAVAVDSEIFGIIYLKDIIKPGIRDRFYQLRRMGIQTTMLTGDNSITAAAIAKEAGVDNFIADATPEGKIDVIRRTQAEGKIVAMTGDGTNDASALKQANIGIAMNTGTQAAREAANIIDLDSDPTKLIDIINISQQLFMTRGALAIFSLTNDVAKYFAILPLIVASAQIKILNIMNLTSTKSAVLSSLIYSALIIPALIPFAIAGLKSRTEKSNQLLSLNILIFGVSGIVIPFFAIKLIDLVLTTIGLS